MQKHIPESVTDPKELELYELARKCDPENFVTICNSLRKGRTTYMRNNKPIRTVEELMNTPIDEIARLRGIGPQRLDSIREMKGMERSHNTLLYLVVTDTYNQSYGANFVIQGIFNTLDKAKDAASKAYKKDFYPKIFELDFNKEYSFSDKIIGGYIE